MTHAWASEGGGRGGLSPMDFEIFSKKSLFSYFCGGKNKFHHFWPPIEKFWKNPLVVLPAKNPSDAHRHT